MTKRKYDYSKYKDKDHIELYQITDVYQSNEKINELTNEVFEEYSIIKRDVICKRKLYKDDIQYIKEVFNNQGNIRTQRVEVGIKNNEPVIVAGSYSNIDKVLFNSNKPNMGFKFYE